MRKTKHETLHKVAMYFISLWLLFILIIIIRLIKPDACSSIRDISSLLHAMRFDLLSAICLALATLGVLLMKFFEHHWRGTTDLPVKIKEIEDKNYDYLTFLTTYIIPFACLDLDKISYIITLVLLLLIIGLIFVRSNFYLANPTLALFNYRLYNVKYCVDGDERTITVLSKDVLKNGDYINTIRFDNDNAYAIRRESIDE